MEGDDDVERNLPTVWNHWRTRDGSEADLVIERHDGGMVGFVIKSARQVSRYDISAFSRDAKRSATSFSPGPCSTWDSTRRDSTTELCPAQRSQNETRPEQDERKARPDDRTTTDWPLSGQRTQPGIAPRTKCGVCEQPQWRIGRRQFCVAIRDAISVPDNMARRTVRDVISRGAASSMTACSQPTSITLRAASRSVPSDCSVYINS